MSKKELIQKFLSSDRIAVAGVSRNIKKFGYIVFKELKNKGYNVIPVNPNLTDIDGEQCYPSVNEIPGDISALLIVVKPLQTEELLNNLHKEIKIVWLQPGSESDSAIDICDKAGIDVITGECILLFAKPEGFHNLHRFVRKIFGKLPD